MGNKIILYPILLLTALLLFSTYASAEDIVTVDNHTLAKYVTKDFRPVDLDDVFYTTDDKVYSWIELTLNVTKKHNIIYKWYSPNDQLFNSTEMTVDQSSADQLVGFESLNIRCNIPENMTGNWRLDVYMDDKRILAEDFVIQKPDT